MELLGFTNWHDKKYHDIEGQTDIDIAYGITVQYMKRHGYRFTGEYHQYGECGAPYFDTNQKLCLSMRGWGALMAQVLDLPEDIDGKLGIDMSYCHWAWWAEPEKFVLPIAP